MTRFVRTPTRAKHRSAAVLALTVGLWIAPSLASHAELQIPNQFVAGDKAIAADVNENFDAAATAIDQLEARIEQLESQLEALAPIAALLSVDPGELNGVAGPNLVIEGANLHIQSGSGTTDDASNPTGLGNLIIGYNEVASGQQVGDRAGAHNLVMGESNLFTNTGGIVAGTENTIEGLYASVLGGTSNSAAGDHAVVSGGAFNQANGQESAVSGGVSNFATALRSAASGGAQNTVSGIAASISGGSGGAVGGFAASISGGQSGIASGDQSTVVGGQSNSAFGDKSVAGGGFNQSVTADFDWRACDLSCP